MTSKGSASAFTAPDLVADQAEEILLTVVMTAFNAMNHIEAAVDSILAQTFRDFEFIVVDDGSTDGTGEFLDGIDDDRVVVIHQPNAGQHAAAQRAIDLSSSRYIARMDADDVSDPQRFEKQVFFLERDLRVGLVGSQIYRMGESGSTTLRSSFPTAHDEIYEELIHNRHAMCNPATMFRRQLFTDIGGYWEYDIAEDWDMFLRMGEVSELANLDEPLLSYRFHTTSINGRRMLEAQLHNEYACELARRRNDGRPQVSYVEFSAGHRSNQWPGSWLFRADIYSVSQYRRAVAALSEGNRVVGALRLGVAMISSPTRSTQRVLRVLRNRRAGDG